MRRNSVTGILLSKHANWTLEKEWINDHAEDMIRWHRMKLTSITRRRNSKIPKVTKERSRLCLFKQQVPVDTAQIALVQEAAFHESISESNLSMDNVQSGECVARVFYALKTQYIQSIIV